MVLDLIKLFDSSRVSTIGFSSCGEKHLDKFLQLIGSIDVHPNDILTENFFLPKDSVISCRLDELSSSRKSSFGSRTSVSNQMVKHSNIRQISQVSRNLGIKIILITNVYYSLTQKVAFRGGNSILYESDIAIIFNDLGISCIKNRFSNQKIDIKYSEIRNEIIDSILE